MLVRNFMKTLLLGLCFTLANCETETEGDDWQDDRVVLSAAELVNLVRRELGLVASASNSSRHEKKSTTIEQQFTSNDENTLKDRKVWSRWSKWSKCSSGCGAGTMTRQRLCVAGRCAPGEKEEQHRVCEGDPCLEQEGASSTRADHIDVPTEIDPDPDEIE